MFDNLTNRLNTIFDRLRGYGRLTEENVQEALREVRVALLEADVNFKVVKGFVERVREKAIGQDVLKSLTPGQQVVKVVRDELVELLGGSAHRLAMAPHPPTVIMLVGLQGSGKTTTAAKLARLFQKGRASIRSWPRPTCTGRPPSTSSRRSARAWASAGAGRSRRLAGGDLPRGARRGGPARASPRSSSTPPGGCTSTRRCSASSRPSSARCRPHHVLLVVDAMTGQDAVTVADKFNAAVGVDAFVLTKMDGDARGGAALSVRTVTGRPIAFVGMGEKTDALEPFHPDRLAARILGMGDVLSLVEKAQAVVDQSIRPRSWRRRSARRRFSARGFRPAAQAAPLDGPARPDHGHGAVLQGRGRDAEGDASGEESELRRYEAIIASMTPAEREEPSVINGSRRMRIARGSGTQVADVNRLLKQHAQLKKMMKGLKQMEGRMGKLKGALPFLGR